VSPEEVALEEEPEAELSDLVDDLVTEVEEAPPAETADDDSDILEVAADDLVNGSELDGAELDLGDDSDDDLASMELDMSSDGSDDDEGLVFAVDGDEIATKLDLARAYIDMGDDEGARSILQEVMEGGNETQQQEARTLLEGID
jgi:pilus assembly protein FimV